MAPEHLNVSGNYWQLGHGLQELPALKRLRTTLHPRFDP
jgi:hypothetical protein